MSKELARRLKEMEEKQKIEYQQWLDRVLPRKGGYLRQRILQYISQQHESHN